MSGLNVRIYITPHPASELEDTLNQDTKKCRKGYIHDTVTFMGHSYEHDCAFGNWYVKNGTRLTMPEWLIAEVSYLAIALVQVHHDNLPLGVGLNAYLGSYTGTGKYASCSAKVENYVAHKSRDAQAVTVWVYPDTDGNLPVDDYYSRVRSRQEVPTVWRQPIPRQYRNKTTS